MLLARIPSLSSFLPTVKPGETPLDKERGDAAVARSGLAFANTMKISASLPFVIQSFRPVMQPVAVGAGRARRHREGVAPEPASDKA